MDGSVVIHVHSAVTDETGCAVDALVTDVLVPFPSETCSCVEFMSTTLNACAAAGVPVPTVPTLVCLLATGRARCVTVGSDIMRAELCVEGASVHLVPHIAAVGLARAPDQGAGNVDPLHMVCWLGMERYMRLSSAWLDHIAAKSEADSDRWMDDAQYMQEQIASAVCAPVSVDEERASAADVYQLAFLMRTAWRHWPTHPAMKTIPVQVANTRVRACSVTLGSPAVDVAGMHIVKQNQVQPCSLLQFLQSQPQATTLMITGSIT
jgi:hypothetical protein